MPVIGAAMPRLVLLTVLLASLVVASPAAAKEVQSVKACGVGDCETSKAAGLMRGMTDVGPPTSAPQAPAPFYRLTMAIGDGNETFGHFKSWWVPAAGVLLGEDGTWMAARPEVRRGLDRLTRGLAALPSARLPGFPAPDTDVSPPRPAAAVTSDSGLPVVPLVAAVAVLALVGLLVRRHVAGSGPSGALGSAE
jgi:hypothetical protein